jgi:hypothetical protein
MMLAKLSHEHTEVFAPKKDDTDMEMKDDFV